METIERISLYLNRALISLGGILLVGMIILTCSNIFSRWVWIPVRGTFELMGFLGAMVAAFALGQTQMNRGHIAVNVLINKFSYKTRKFLTFINSTICLSFFFFTCRLADRKIGRNA